MGIKRMIAIAALALSLGSYAQADTPFSHSRAASQHSATASAHSLAAGVKGASAAVAVPFLVVGSVGAVSQAAGEGALRLATDPLPIGEQVVHRTTSPAKITVTPRPDIAIGSTK